MWKSTVWRRFNFTLDDSNFFCMEKKEKRKINISHRMKKLLSYFLTLHLWRVKKNSQTLLRMLAFKCLIRVWNKLPPKRRRAFFELWCTPNNAVKNFLQLKIMWKFTSLLLLVPAILNLSLDDFFCPDSYPTSLFLFHLPQNLSWLFLHNWGTLLSNTFNKIKLT